MTQLNDIPASIKLIVQDIKNSMISLEKRISSLEERTKIIEEKFDTMIISFTRMEGGISRMEEKVSDATKHMDKVAEECLESLKGRTKILIDMNGLKTQIKTIWILIIMIISSILGIAFIKWG